MAKKKKKRAEFQPDPFEIEDIQPKSEETQNEHEAAETETPDPLTELTREKNDLWDQLLRKQAEFDNYRKRVVRDKMEARLSSQEEVLKEILPLLDSCEMGLESIKKAIEEDERLAVYYEGYQLFLKSLETLLTRFGVTAVPGPGETFDPAHHEAVLREESTDFEDGQIIDEFRRGYLYQGRLLRASQVRVAVKPEETTSN